MLTKQTNSAKTLKQVCPTRWSSRIQDSDALRSRYSGEIKILTHLSLNGENYDQQHEPKSLMSYVEQFTNVFLVIIKSKIFEPINTV